MIAVILVVIGIVAAFALGIIAAMLYMEGEDDVDAWEEERRGRR